MNSFLLSNKVFLRIVLLEFFGKSKIGFFELTTADY